MAFMLPFQTKLFIGQIISFMQWLVLIVLMIYDLHIPVFLFIKSFPRCLCDCTMTSSLTRNTLCNYTMTNSLASHTLCNCTMTSPLARQCWQAAQSSVGGDEMVSSLAKRETARWWKECWLFSRHISSTWCGKVVWLSSWVTYWGLQKIVWGPAR